jgi:hypothetical protein
MIEDDACVICHDEAQAIVTYADYLSYEGGGTIEAAACDEHLVAAFAYLVAVEAPRRGRHLSAGSWAEATLATGRAGTGDRDRHGSPPLAPPEDRSRRCHVRL